MGLWLRDVAVMSKSRAAVQGVVCSWGSRSMWAGKLADSSLKEAHLCCEVTEGQRGVAKVPNQTSVTQQSAVVGTSSSKLKKNGKFHRHYLVGSTAYTVDKFDT